MRAPSVATRLRAWLGYVLGIRRLLVWTLNSSPNPGKSAAACFVIEHRQLGGKVVARIGNVTVNDRNHVFYRTHEEFATLAAAILAIPVLRPALEIAQGKA